MNADTLMQRILAYGADESGIQDRFLCNAALYESCFLDFINEPHFALLGDAVAAHDYAAAFSSAHALKGIAGNLGVTPFYSAICALVESLRAGRYEAVAAEYAEVVAQYNRLAALLSDEPPALPDAPEADARGNAQPSAAKTARRRDNFFLHSAILLAILLFGVAWMFCRVYLEYRENVTRESASHLIELNQQLKLYIEGEIAIDWKIAHSVGDSIADSNYQNDDAAILRMMRRKKDVWKVSDIMLYTEDGYGVSANGHVETNDVASETVNSARSRGEYLSIVDSNIIYTVPVETGITYRGSRIAAVSVVQSMGSFLDEMGFTSFDGGAWIYLTDETGVVISRLTNASSLPTFNFIAVTEGRKLEAITDAARATEGLLTATSPAIYLMSGENGNEYVVSTPIATQAAPLRVFYLVPERIVNQTVTSFSIRLITLSLFVILIFSVFGLLILLFVYRMRKRAFDQALKNRERMFDLLVHNTRTSFALFELNNAEPVYISSNSEEITGTLSFSLQRTDEGFRLLAGAGMDAAAIRAVNDAMRNWDGVGEFKSGYIRSGASVPEKYFEILLYPADDAGQAFVGIAQDMTQEHAREQATKDALDAAERANVAKSRFLSNMSHDIRTPMNAIVNMTEFAIRSIGQPKKLSAYLQTIRESSDHLLRLINDVLDMSRIESGQTSLLSEPFDVKAELMRQAAIIEPLCAEKKLTLLSNFDGVSTAIVRGDRLKFSQIIMNLLGNAAKFTPEHGAVRFTAVEIPAPREGLVNLRITVEDTGIGISKEYLPHIFEAFSRADSGRVSKTEGTGLGLSICESYINAMGGTIACESEEGEGSTFTVELFFEEANAALAEARTPAAFGEVPFLGKHCLVCEDNSINQTIAKTMLEQLGFLVDLASDGWEGVQKFEKSAPGCYDVIYMDVQMPVMDGYQATVTIRRSEHPDAKTVPIVAMTANVFANDIEKARIAGMNGYLGKPILSYNLIEETDQALRKRKDRAV